MKEKRQHPEGNRPVRHILSLSGGKDSSALAIYLKDRIPELEYVFADTGEELPETYEYLERLEAFLGQPITYLNPERSFETLLKARGGFLPSPQARWCTEYLKIKPFERYLKDDLCYNYIGIRADEPYRKGYISSKPNIIPRYPFVEDGITEEDVIRILEDSGLGLPTYYEWRSRSGCYFCFFQRRIEWVGLLEHHPDLFIRAMSFEKFDVDTGVRYTWNETESLAELTKPERIRQIKEEFAWRKSRRHKVNLSLADVFTFDDEESEKRVICHL